MKISRILFICLSLAIYSSLASQNEYVKEIGCNAPLISYRATATGDTGVLMAGVRYDDDVSFYVKLNKTGMVDWSLTDEYANATSVHTIDQKIFIGGAIDSTGYLLCLNPNGQKQWSKRISVSGSPNDYVVAMTSDNTDLYLLSQSQPNLSSNDSHFYPVLSKVDTAGNVLWSRQYDTPGYPSDIIFDSITHHLLFLVYSSGNSCLVSSDLNGNPVWKVDYPIEFSKIAPAQNGSVIVTGLSSSYWSNISMLDSSGVPQWTTQLNNSTYLFSTTPSIYVSESGSVFVGTYKSLPGNVPAPCLLKFNSAGNFQWGEDIIGGSLDEAGISGIFSNSYNGLLVTGGRFNLAYSFFCVSADTSFQSSCSINPVFFPDSSYLLPHTSSLVISVGVSLILSSAPDSLYSINTSQIFDCISGQSENIQESFDISVFPNPSNGALTISGDLPTESTFILLNMIGQQVIDPVVLVSLNFEGYSLHIDVLPGIYLYQIKSNNQTLKVGKLVVN